MIWWIWGWFYWYNESDRFFYIVYANLKISDWFHESEIAFWLSVSTFQKGWPVVGQLKIGSTSQEPGGNHHCNLFSTFNIFTIFLIYSIDSIYWRWAPQVKSLATYIQFSALNTFTNKSDSKYVLDRVHCCLYFRSTKRANKCQESGTSAQNIVLRIQKQTNKNKDKTKQKGQVKMWEARILLWKFISGSAISDYLK